MPVDTHDRFDDQTDNSDEFHVAGVVVYARIESLKRVAEHLAELPGAEVHGFNADGRIVLTLEGNRSFYVAELLHAVQALPDVVSTALVYQHHEHVDPLSEEIADETDSSRVH
ncbi:chaperone NapD [Caballeronia insecticola]|uniref:Chaperone NapD n=1 Tax=Caballeronia insecticola TaxID=758793 RepID=R4WU51_9BURK|nr:chaperone NapD [Caballeronia insecticola]BAN28094.1 periplasmic nitrate reductase chaperone NapD [Caballeronia insecticola]